MKDEDEVTVAAGSDVLAQIREEALKLRREHTGEDAEVVPGIVVWSADAPAAADEEADDVKPLTTDFDPSLDKTSVLGTADWDAADDLTEFAMGSDPTVALDRPPSADPPPSRVIRPAPASTVARVSDDGASLIGSALPPTASAVYFESADTSAAKPASASVRRQVRRRLPTWFLVLVVALVIIGLSVVIALLVASGAST